MDERPADFQLGFLPGSVKQEPIVDEAEMDVIHHGNTGEQQQQVASGSTATPAVKREPTEENTNVAMEEIMSKAAVLDSLTKKIGIVNAPTVSEKDVVKNQINGIIEVLDDDIEITSENIVNPGSQTLSKVLNQFLTQVEELDKNINVDECSKNVNLEKYTSRKEEENKELTEELAAKKEEVKFLEKELEDKNDEIESILLNSVSKENFVRTQFMNLTSEVRVLKEEKTRYKDLTERVKELEKQTKNKTLEIEDWKEKFQKSEDSKKMLEEKNTKIVGEITKGVAEKLSQMKTKDEVIAALKEKVQTLETDLKALEIRFQFQNEDLVRIKEDYSTKSSDQVKLIKEKEEENKQLVDQNANLTKRFREKVKDIQETLTKYNETLKSKNSEISEKSQEIEEIKEHQATQGNLICILKKSVKEKEVELEKLKESGASLEVDLKARDEEVSKLRSSLEESIKASVQQRIEANKVEISKKVVSKKVVRVRPVIKRRILKSKPIKVSKLKKRKKTETDASPPRKVARVDPVCAAVREEQKLPDIDMVLRLEPLYPSLVPAMPESSCLPFMPRLSWPVVLTGPQPAGLEESCAEPLLSLRYNWPLVPYKSTDSSQDRKRRSSSEELDDPSINKKLKQ